MRRARVVTAGALAVIAAGAVLVVAPSSSAQASVGFGPGDAAWDAYYAHPSDHSTWDAYCAGGGGTVKLEAMGVPACGPTGATDIELAGSSPHNTMYTQGFQCVELVIRYLKVIKGYNPVVVNGGQTVDGYAAAYSLPKVINGTSGKYPVAGTVLSFTSTGDWTDLGHAAVVTASSVDSSGNGSVTFANENFSNTAEAITEPITHWSMRLSNLMGAGGTFTNVKWLDFGGGITPTPTPTITGTPGPSPSSSSTPTPDPSPTSSVTPTPTPTAVPLPTAQPTVLPAAPRLTQTTAGTTVTLDLSTVSAFVGKTVIFFQRSGMTGKVHPQGTSAVLSSGHAYRTLQLSHGQIMAVYAKLLVDATQIQSQYSNTKTFKVA